MFLSLKTVVVTSIAVGGLATGVAGAAPPRGNDVVQRVTAASVEEQQLHTSIAGLTVTEHQLEAVLAARRSARAAHVDAPAPAAGLAPAAVVRSPTVPSAPGGTVPASGPVPGPTADTVPDGPSAGQTTGSTADPDDTPTTTAPAQDTTTTTTPPTSTTSTTAPHRGGDGGGRRRR